MKRSEDIQEITKALVKFQAEVKNPANTGVNPHFGNRYAPLSDILNDVRPLLAKHGIAIVQIPSETGSGKVSVTTILLHESGQWIEAEPIVLNPVKSDPQGVGSAITYGRRYSISSVLGIASEDDDDANAASEPITPAQDDPPQKQPKPTTKKKPTERDMLIAKIKPTAQQYGLKSAEVKQILREQFNTETWDNLNEDELHALLSMIKAVGEMKAEEE